MTGPSYRLGALGWLAVTPAQRRAVATHSVRPGAAPRTGCEGCGAELSLAGGLRPFLPGARCAGCGARVGAPPWSVELAFVAALLLAFLGAGAGAGPVLPAVAFAWWAAWAVPLVFVDLAVHRLPDRLTLPAAAGTWLLLAAAGLAGTTGVPGLAGAAGGATGVANSAGSLGDAGRAVLAGLAVAAVFAASTLLLGRRGFGLGDAKLALGASALLGWYGWPAVLTGLLLAVVASGCTALVLLLTRRVRWASELPFGPFLVLGTVVTIAVMTWRH
ncbi:A24 family peptidase [Plantactinospora sp. KBS50]|uniref:prepilin peptidase n=1 Tax=Plantactinospora sp. KBS50 TaxID=2024580 RepID=UPI000BAAB030|nr:A24 family peptidase [Plantactinospora sp. KBS50]ASW53106.1 hypothetical protein CIK06_01245 [Plantactinospora sp. KBS50]